MAGHITDQQAAGSYGYADGEFSRNLSPESSPPSSARGGDGEGADEARRDLPARPSVANKSDASNGGGRRSFTLRRQVSLMQIFAESEDADDDEAAAPQQPRGAFFDVVAMKEIVRKNMMKEPYDVSKYYHETGLWRDIATSPVFEKLTLAVIALNAIWIGVETDYNGAAVLIHARPIFQIVEHFFCLFFAFEWLSRFMSFKQKRKGLRDGWFVFDTMLVGMMVMETWIFTLLMFLSGSSGSGGLGNASILRMARLARLSRMARMARLLKAMPELMILIKGIATATRSVFFTLCLLCLLLYIFGIAFTQLLVGTEVGEERFRTVPLSMYTLLCSGTFLDGIGEVLDALCDTEFYYGAVYLLFVLLATVTVLNMLIGVLCEVVSSVASVEKETMIVNFVKQRLLKVLQELDEDGNGTISKDEFMKVLDSREACEALDECGVDVEGIYDFADFIFQDDESGNDEKELRFGEFMEIMLTFRGSNNATVKDIADLTKFVKKNVCLSSADLKKLRELVVNTMDMYEKLIFNRDGGGLAAMARCESPSGDDDDDHHHDGIQHLRKTLVWLKEQLPDAKSASLADCCSAARTPPQTICDGASLADELLDRGLKAVALLKDAPEYPEVPEAFGWTLPSAETGAPQEKVPLPGRFASSSELFALQNSEAQAAELSPLKLKPHERREDTRSEVSQGEAKPPLVPPEPCDLPGPRLFARQPCHSQPAVAAAGDAAGGWPMAKVLDAAGFPHWAPRCHEVPLVEIR